MRDAVDSDCVEALKRSRQATAVPGGEEGGGAAAAAGATEEEAKAKGEGSRWVLFRFRPTLWNTGRDTDPLSTP